MQGAAPLASPGELNPGGTGAGSEPRARREVAIPVACRPCRSGIRRGGLPSLSPARPAFSFISFPYPPDPLPPWGRGRILVFLYKGRSPLHEITLFSPSPEGKGRGMGAKHPLAFAGAEPGQRGFNFGYSLPVGFGGIHRFKSIQIREKFWGVWGTLSRVPQRFSRVSPPRLQRFSFSGRWCRPWYRPA